MKFVIAPTEQPEYGWNTNKSNKRTLCSLVFMNIKIYYRFKVSVKMYHS